MADRLTPDEMVERARRAHRDVWCREPFTRTPVNEQQARDNAAAAAYNDQHQQLNEVFG